MPRIQKILCIGNFVFREYNKWSHFFNPVKLKPRITEPQIRSFYCNNTLYELVIKMADDSSNVLACKANKNENSLLNDNNISPKKNINDNEESSTDDNDNIHELMNNLSNFSAKQILRNDANQKLIAVEGKFKGCDEPALVILEKKTFPKEESLLNEAFFNDETTVKKSYRNDIYRGYDFFPAKEHNGVAATIIYPATPKHIERFTPAPFYMVEETPEIYKNVTLPSIESQQFSLQWIDNILNGTAETERVVFRDPDEETGFVLVKDLKMKDDKSIYLIALARRKLKSIRELNKSHLPMLRNIKEAGIKAIKENFDVDPNQLRIFLHYQPSYYHLHVHFTTLDIENAGTVIERAHLLTSVIDNIEMVSDYYQRATLTFRVCKEDAYKPYKDYLKNDTSEPPLKRPKNSA